MWTKTTNKLVCYKEDGCIFIYDESSLRKSLISYLSDASRARYGGENFATEDMFLAGLEWHLNGLRCLLKS